jgi:hypothetical protein
MSYTAYVCETVTGKNLGPLDCKIVNWSRELNGTDTATVAMFPSSKGGLSVANRDWIRLITQPPRMTLVIEWNSGPASAGSIMFAGPIWQRPMPDGLSVNFTASGVRSLFTRRKALMWTLPYASQVLSYANMSLGSIAVSLVRDVALAGSKAGASLPIVFPASEVDTDATHVRTYNGYALSNIDQLLTDLTNVINGPDIDFTPSWSGPSRQFLQYTMRVGTDEQPKLMQAAPISFDASQPKSAVKLLTTLDDASAMSTTAWALGSGDGTSVLMSKADNAATIAAGYPLLEQETDYLTVGDQPTLDAHTAGDLTANALPATQFGLAVDVTQPPAFGSYLLGDNVFVAVRNHFWIPDSPPGGYPMRLVKLSGDATTTATMDVQNA